jgi:hypothetical protein
MAAATYSLSVTAVGAHTAFQPKNQQIDDNFCNAIGQELETMRLGASFLSKGPDGALVRHVLDAERTIPGVLRVIRRA